MTPATILSFLEALTKKGSDNPTREGMGGILRQVLKLPDRKAGTNLGNWGHGITAMPADYQSSSEAPPM